MRCLGANAILGVSLAAARAAAAVLGLPLYQYLGGPNAHVLPTPKQHVLNGGAHSTNTVAFQEFKLMPVGACSVRVPVRMGSETFHALQALLCSCGAITAVGAVRGFAPNLCDNVLPFELLVVPICMPGTCPGAAIALAFDVAASEKPAAALCTTTTCWSNPACCTTTVQWTNKLAGTINCYPIVSVVHPIEANDWVRWQTFTECMGDMLQIVGAALFVLNTDTLCCGIAMGVANSIQLC